MTASADAATSTSGSPLSAIADAVSSEIVDVVLTLNGREVPSRAYSAIGTVATYNPTSTGSPASEA